MHINGTKESVHISELFFLKIKFLGKEKVREGFHYIHTLYCIQILNSKL